MVNILGFEGHMVSVTTLQLCQHGAKAAIHTHTHTHTHTNTKAWLCSNKTLFIEAVGGQIWLVDHSLQPLV